ncbi:MAG: hypothetical protein JWQ38_1392 [Flavipsychrobacter sp.]|nr:hypothetical protein [Flavipsychrobacter sp.]
MPRRQAVQLRKDFIVCIFSLRLDAGFSILDTGCPYYFLKLALELT